LANAFVGNVLRLEILSRYGCCQQILDESIGYNLYMAERTGTLWENDGAYASCNHGFASHVAHMLYRDVLGLYRIDPVNKTVRLRFSDLDMDWCDGRVPTDAGAVSLRWWKEGEGIHYRASVPAGYRLKIENLSGKRLTRR
jgi:alpha-L-rhamnosidase